MGNFIDVAAVLAPQAKVQEYLTETGEEAGCISTLPDRTLVIYEESTGDFDRIQELSEKLGVPAFALHIHDDDLWVYELYVTGVLKDRFNPIPEYWQKISAEEQASWKGDPQVLAAHWRDLKPEDVSAYLIHWDEDLIGESRSYPDDRSTIGDCWQLTDFLRKLGTPYPD